MDEQRRKTDVNMLQALLENPGDSGIDLILRTNPKSIDFGFVQTLYVEEVALTRESLLKAAKFFQRAIAPLESAKGNYKLPANGPVAQQFCEILVEFV